MNVFISLLPFFALGSSFVLETPKDRIINGADFDPNSPEWSKGFVGILIDGTFKCGGVLYNGNTVATSAYCLQGVTEPSRVTVISGVNQVSGATQLTTLLVAIHPQFDPSSTTVKRPYDVAVIKIAQNLSGLPPATICPDGQDCGTDGASMRIVGLGANVFSGIQFPTFTMQTDMLLANADAAAEWGNAFDASIQIGANGVTDMTGPCQMDEGGPLFRDDGDNRLCGILSYYLVHNLVIFPEGQGCNLTRSVVFTNLCNAGIKSWIASVEAPTTTTTEPTTTTPTTTTPTTTTATTTTTTTTTTRRPCTGDEIIGCITSPTDPNRTCDCPDLSG